jgi:hypothetical protein
MKPTFVIPAGAAAMVLVIAFVGARASASSEDVHARQPEAQRSLKRSTKTLKRLAATPAGRLALLASRLAADAEEHSPQVAHYVRGSRRAVNRADNGDQIKLPDQSVYYVVVHGNFVAKNAFVPPGSPPPTGTVMAFTVDPETYDVLDYSLSDKPRDLARFGAPVRLAIP